MIIWIYIVDLNYIPIIVATIRIVSIQICKKIIYQFPEFDS